MQIQVSILYLFHKYFVKDKTRSSEWDVVLLATQTANMKTEGSFWEGHHRQFGMQKEV